MQTKSGEYGGNYMGRARMMELASAGRCLADGNVRKPTYIALKEIEYLTMY